METTLPQSDRRLYVCPTVEAKRESSRCIFCGAILTGRRTREHIFAQWLTDHYHKRGQPFQIMWTSYTDGELRGRRDLAMTNLVAGRVCRDCNHGWMSTLEAQVRNLLPAVASGERALVELGRAERELLARWATKTAFAARSAGLGPKVISAAHAGLLAKDKMPPVHVVARQAEVDIGLGWFATQRWLITYPHQALPEAARLVGRSHKTVLGIKRLLVAVCFWPDSRWPVVISRRSHSPLWPAEGPG